MMMDVVRRGTGQKAMVLGRSDLAGKTRGSSRPAMIEGLPEDVYRGKHWSRALGVWVHGDGKGEVLNIQLRAANGGGYVFMSDHSVSSDVSGHTYDLIVKLVREFGTYPLDLPEA